MSKFSVLIALAAATFALASPASADVLDNIQIKLGLSGVIPDESASISAIGGDVDISDEIVPTLQIEYFFTDAVSVELLCCMARHDVKAVDTAIGEVDLGKISHFPPTVTVKYHFNTEGKFQPYLGAGVNYTLFFDEDLPAGPVTAIDYDPSFGGALQVGLDYRLNEHWSLNADVRKIWIQTDVSLQTALGPVEADVDVNPYVVTLGAGYRF